MTLFDFDHVVGSSVDINQMSFSYYSILFGYEHFLPATKDSFI